MIVSRKYAASCLGVLILASCGTDKDPLDSASAGSVGPSGGPGDGPTGDPTDGVTSSVGGTDTAGSDHAICDAYLACIAVATPDALPNNEASFGPNGVCWQGTLGAIEQCLMTCEQGLANLGVVFPDEPACGGSSGGSSSSSGGTSGGTSESMGSITGVTTDDTPCANPQPNGADCWKLDCACISGKCYLLFDQTSVCGECVNDDDCPAGGCSPPVGYEGSFCNAGGLGDVCETDDACGPAAPLCVEVYDGPIPGLSFTCSECLSDVQCPAQEPTCTPTYEQRLFFGHHACKADGSVPNDSGCSLEPGGEAACASGFCGETLIMGLLPIGLCGECSVDNDCSPGETCAQPVWTMNSMKGAACV